jgi:hypothetical protein
MAEDKKKTQEEIDAEANPDAALASRPIDLTGPGFPPMPTEPAKPHTEAELNKLGQTLDYGSTSYQDLINADKTENKDK